MKLTFLGTRGEIEPRTAEHGMHTAALVEYRRRRVMIDCGADWLGKLSQVRPHSIVLTHAHPDHAWGLKGGAPCLVWGSADTWALIKDYPIIDRHVLEPGRPADVEGVQFTAFTVEHSTRCPAVGYRISAGGVDVFYVPDLVFIHDAAGALDGVRAYIGDGATMTLSMVRKQGERLIGHTPVRTQLGWCAKHGVERAIITHCGAGIVTADQDQIRTQLQQWGRERGVSVELAHDGMQVVLR